VHPSPRAADGRPAHLRPLFVGLVVITLLTALDQTIVATALPTIVAELGGERQIGWVFAAYTLAMTVAMPVFGRLGDLRGRRGLYLGSVVAFVLASVLCGFAQDLPQLIALRLAQGIGGGGVAVLSQAVVADAVPARDRGRFLAPIGAVYAVASVLGPLVGGALTDTVGWRWIFWVNAPLGGLALLLAVVSVPRVVPESRRERFDVPGAALLVVWVTGLVLVAAWGGTTWPWSSAEVLVTAGVSLVALLAFVRRCRTTEHPLIPVTTFADRTVVVSSALAFVVGAAVFGMVGYLPGAVQAGYGLPATAAGSVVLPLVLGLMVTSLWTARRIARTGRYRRLPLAGCAVAAVGMLGLAALTPGTPLVLVCAAPALVGLGVGCFMQVTTVAVQDAVPARLVGTATSTVALVRELGVAIGAAAFGGLLSTRLLAGLGERRALVRLTPEQLRRAPATVRSDYAEAYLHALGPLFAGLAVLFGVAFLAALFLPDRRLAAALPEVTPITPADAVHQPESGRGPLTTSARNRQNDVGDQQNDAVPSSRDGAA
jgi:EmrB/QacA subfamily drug resistance transporter